MTSEALNQTGPLSQCNEPQDNKYHNKALETPKSWDLLLNVNRQVKMTTKPRKTCNMKNERSQIKTQLETQKLCREKKNFLKTMTSVFSIRWQPHNINSMLEHREI